MDITFIKNIYIKDKILFSLIIIIFFVPISLILGNAIVNINIFISGALLLSLIIKNGKINLLFSADIFILFLFFLSILFTDMISSDDLNYKSFFLFKFYVFFISVKYVFQINKKLIDVFSYYILNILIIFSIDIIFQYYFGRDIIGIYL